MKSTKFWIASIAMVCITGINAYAMYLGVKVPIEFTAFITGIAGSFGIFKTYQNVILSNGKDNGVEK